MEILIAEDDFVTRRLLQKTLEEWGFEVFAAEDGQSAWEIFRANNIKLVVADWMMPRMDGITLCRNIRSSGSPGYVYVILLTGKDGKENIIEGLNAGADDYVTKPFDRDELRVRVRAGERILNLEKDLNEKNEKLLALNSKLEELACIDPLTEIGNRRSFYTAIEKIHHRACRYGRESGIIMCDLDYFKAYNDIYGHVSGDHVLKTVAQSIRHILRASEETFRFGGEEIVVVLPDQNLDCSLVAAERIREHIESLGIEHKGSPKGVITVSCGVSVFERECEDVKWEGVLERADKALYMAKSLGKNLVCSPHGAFSLS